MSANVSFAQNSRFKMGWIILLVIAALMTLGHFGLIFFFMDERVLFAGLASSNLYAFLVIYLLFRRGEKWAWVVTWTLPALALLIAVTNPSLAIYYYGVAAVCVLGLLLTMRDFFSQSR
jgi:hypothetical protein